MNLGRTSQAHRNRFSIIYKLYNSFICESSGFWFHGVLSAQVLSQLVSRISFLFSFGGLIFTKVHDQFDRRTVLSENY